MNNRTIEISKTVDRIITNINETEKVAGTKATNVPSLRLV